MPLHNPFHRYGDAALLQAERAMRVRAWIAPKSLPGNYNDAHSRFSDEWCQLHREVKRRGLRSSTEDVAFAPQADMPDER